jgi:hypothetical protein
MVALVWHRVDLWVGKMSRVLMFVGPWVILGSLAENRERKSVPVRFT